MLGRVQWIYSIIISSFECLFVLYVWTAVLNGLFQLAPTVLRPHMLHHFLLLFFSFFNINSVISDLNH